MEAFHDGSAEAFYFGMATHDYDRYGITGQQVDWVTWDSPAAGLLHIGDVITGVHVLGGNYSAVRVPRFAYPYVNTHEIRHALQLSSGEKADFTLLRAGEQQTVSITPVVEPAYTTANGRRSLFPGGPYYLASDSFRESWSAWYERIVKSWSHILCDEWRSTNFNSQQLLREHQEERKRIDFLLERFPGAFSGTMLARWNEVDENLRGKQYSASEIDLSYRDFENARVTAFQTAANAAHERFRKELDDRLKPAYPAPDPYSPDAAASTGKIIRIDRVSPRDMRGSGPQAWYIMGSRYDGWYFLNAHSQEVLRLGDCMLAYQNQVTPQLPERFTFYLEILNEPIMRPLERRNVVRGFKTRLLAALVGDVLFVDMLDTGAPRMAGLDTLQNSAIGMPADNSSPEDIVRARIASVKWSRRDVWSALMADWTVSTDLAGHPIFLPYASGISDSHSHWERSRKRLFDDVMDAIVTGSNPIYTVLAADEARGIPHVEETDVCVEHVGQFDGEYRGFKDNWLTRYWRVQRLNGGPWRLVYPGTL